MIITMSVFAISKGNPPFVTPKTLQCVLQNKTLVLLAARKIQILNGLNSQESVKIALP